MDKIHTIDIERNLDAIKRMIDDCVEDGDKQAVSKIGQIVSDAEREVYKAWKK